jgi:hypothetical protein
MPNTIYNPLTGNFDYVIDDAAEIAYTPADPADWPVAPDDTKEALDSLANTVASLSVGAAPDATTTTKGIVKLAGDLGGTADVPTVPDMVKSVSNVGGGQGVFYQKNGYDIELKSITGSGSVSVTTVGTEISILGSGEANTASNVGAGDGVFKQKTGADLEFKSLVAGSNVTITSAADTLTIDASGGGSGSGLTTFELLANAKMLQGEYGFSSDAKEAFTQSTLKMDIVSDRLVFWTSSHFYPIVSNTSPRYVFFGSSSITASKPVVVGSNVFFKNRVISSTNFLSVNVATPSNWSSSSIPGTPFVSVASSGSLAVAIVTSTASYYTSSDGVTWTLRSYNVAPSPSNPARIHFANNLFFITQNNSSAHLTSPDGLTWTARSGVGLDSKDIVWGAAPAIYVSISGFNILTSPDAITWSLRTNPLGNNATCISLTYSATNRFLILTASGIIQSTDGITWTITNYCNGLSLSNTNSTLVQTSTGITYLSIGREIYFLTNLGARIVPYELDSFASIKQVTTGVVVSGDAQVYFLGKQTSPQIYGMPILNYRPMNDTYYSSTLLSNTTFSTSPIPMSFFDSATVDITGYSIPSNAPDFVSAAVMGNNLIFYPGATNSFYSTTSTATLECIEGNALPWIPNNGLKPFALIAVSSDPADSIIWYQYSSNGIGVTTSQISNGITGAFKAIAVTNNTFIAVGSSGVSMKYTHSTTNLPDVAANWASANLSSVSTANFTKLVAGNGVFIAIVQELGTNANPIYVSSDLGNSWSAVTLPVFDDTISTSITVFFLKGKFYAMGKNGNFTGGTIAICLSSLDGVNWTNETSQITDIIMESTGSTSDIRDLRFKKVAGRYYSVGCDRNYILPVFEE